MSHRENENVVTWLVSPPKASLYESRTCRKQVTEVYDNVSCSINLDLGPPKRDYKDTHCFSDLRLCPSMSRNEGTVQSTCLAATAGSFGSVRQGYLCQTVSCNRVCDPHCRRGVREVGSLGSLPQELLDWELPPLHISADKVCRHQNYDSFQLSQRYHVVHAAIIAKRKGQGACIPDGWLADDGCPAEYSTTFTQDFRSDSIIIAG